MIARRIAPAARRGAPLLLAALVAGCTGQEAGAEAAAEGAPPATPAAAPAAAPAADDAARPRPGRWAGVAEGGYKGDSILFTVAPNGREVTDVEFRGHWRCGPSASSKTIKRMDVGHVPGAFAIGADGAFAEEKKEPYLLWTVGGRFTAASAASGTIRIEYDTECDTHKLTWTAAPVGR